MTIHRFPCPAKINLFLHVNGRFENGYHKLQTYFQLLDYGDELGIEVTNDDVLAMSQPIEGVNDEDNLIIKAARALQSHTGTTKGAIFSIDKKLPMGGGLGGGSSNAATTLVALNKLWDLDVPTSELMKIGRALGADVPIFVKGVSGFASGIGDIITPAEQPLKWYLIAKPDVHISTADVFTAETLPRNTPLIDFDEYTFENTANDCQSFVCKRHPEVANLLQWLVNYAPARMTGTGACIFAVLESRERAKQLLDILPNKYTGFICRGTHLSTLHERIGTIGAIK